MEERESSTSSSVDFYGSEKQPETEPPRVAGAAKRKAEDVESTDDKKRKLDSSSLSTCKPKPCAGLSPAIWQHVFLFCSLYDLGRLLQVNQSFRSYLTDVSNVSYLDPISGSLRLLKSDSVWASARNALPVKPPKPLPGFSELRMWQLAWSKRCQFCRKENASVPGDKIWQKGPGEDGVRTIWPFGIISCGPCVLKQCQTDSSLLFSSASAVRPALPFTFLTNDGNYIPAYTLQAATTPAGVEIGKYYYKRHVQDITKELDQALSLGNAAAEEWSKGLEARGTERMKTVEHWERWEVKYQWWSDHHEPRRASTHAPLVSSIVPTSHKGTFPTHQSTSPIVHAPVPSGKSAKGGSLVASIRGSSFHTSLTTAVTPSIYMQSRPPTVPHQYTPHPTPSGSVQPGRGERNLHDANEAKANRKADIERRCQRMIPSIPPNILRHMDSFKAALQISQPMTEHAWAMLQPRLLAQLPAAQQAEVDHVARATSTSKTNDRRPPESNLKEAKEIMDREWDEAQRPVREILNTIADQFIHQNWDQGRAVTYENSPKFAVDLLVHVRRVFYADFGNMDDLHGWKPAVAGNIKPKLILEHMKWVYDNKVRPLTEQYRKEIFLCYGDGCEGNTKFYGYEGVVQHFGAKHTNAFSVGNVVVAWREAEWPEQTPFHPDPLSVKHTYHVAPNTSSHAGYSAYYSGYSRAGTATPHMQSHLPQASPGPYFAGHYNGPFAAPQMHPAASPGYEYGHSYGTPMDPYRYQSISAPNYNPQSGNGYTTSPTMFNPLMAAPPAGQGRIPNTNDTLHRSDDNDHRTSMYNKQVSTVITTTQDIWKQTSGVENLPNSLRVYVLLQHVVSKFHIEFNNEPDLNHFIDAFSDNSVLLILKSASGLACKACLNESSNHQPGRQEAKTFTAVDLVSHFKAQHTGSQVPSYGNGPLQGPRDWKEDMIVLPNDRFISGLIHARGMDDDKLLMIATVFPTLFPTPLPKIGIADSNGKVHEYKETLTEEMSGVTVQRSDLPSLASPYTGSPQPIKPAKEYDLQRPSLPGLTNQSGTHSNRRYSYRSSPPQANPRSRYYSESQYYLPKEHPGHEYYHHGEPSEYMTSPRTTRETRPYYEDFHERHPVYHDGEVLYHPYNAEMIAQPRKGSYVQDRKPSFRPIRYVEGLDQPSEIRYTRDYTLPERNISGEKSEATRFPEVTSSRPSTNEQPESGNKPRAKLDLDDGSRYTPPPAETGFGSKMTEQRRPGSIAQSAAASTISNGSRYEPHRMDHRQGHTPDPGRGLRRSGPQRHRYRHHDHVPARYYRYMSVAREEPYTRGASISRSQSKRYEDTRRRIDQQETPQPNTDQDRTNSRDQSVEGGTNDTILAERPVSRGYISVQDRLHPHSPSRYRYAAYPEEPRGPAPVYVDEYGQPIPEYEIIRVPRDQPPTRGAYLSHPSTRYMEPDPENIRYVSYDHTLPQRCEDHPEHRSYEESEWPPPMRGSVYGPQAAYESLPPAIKIEAVESLPDAS